jgi:hypothetical protein
MRSKPLRLTMPRTAEWIDALRHAFGPDVVDAAIRNGIAGGSDFYASEAGIVIGHQLPRPAASFNADYLLQHRPPQGDSA